MDAEQWVRQLEMADQVRRHVQAKEKARAAEEQRRRQEAESRAWMRELCLPDEASRPSPSYSSACKEVDEKMKFDMQSKLDEYMRLLEQIKQKTEDERTAVSLLQEISKDRRTAEIREERGAKDSGAEDSEPATDKQKKFMKNLGIKFPATVTKQEASVLIDEELGKNSE